jgi:hypothetical protein
MREQTNRRPLKKLVGKRMKKGKNTEKSRSETTVEYFMAAITRLAIRTCFESSFSFHSSLSACFALFRCADFVRSFRHSDKFAYSAEFAVCRYSVNWNIEMEDGRDIGRW